MRRHLAFERVVALICVLAIIGLGVLSTHTASVRPVRVLLLTPTPRPVHINRFIYAYYAPPREFCIGSTTRSIVQSDGSYENNLVGGATDGPIPDTDYMQPSGKQQHICLPGTQYDHYYFLGVTFVQGSGCVQQYAAPNGGRFALLHMDCRYNNLASPSFVVPEAPIATPGPIVSFVEGARATQDSTYKNIPAHTNRGLALVYRGHQYVGYSRWPTSYQYSFNSCYSDYSCRADSHLCVVYDNLAATWFRLVELGKDNHAPKQKPFPLKRWGEYRVAHHKRLISPYDPKTRHISWPASLWLKHQSLRGIATIGHFHGTAATGYTVTLFRCGKIYQWSGYHRSKVTPSRCLS